MTGRLRIRHAMKSYQAEASQRGAGYQIHDITGRDAVHRAGDPYIDHRPDRVPPPAAAKLWHRTALPGGDVRLRDAPAA